MKHTSITTLAICWLIGLFVLSSIPAHAQILKNLGKKVEQKANQRLERQIDKAIDKSLDKVEESAENAVKSSNENKGQGTGQTGTLSGLGSILSGGSTVPIRDNYVFELGITYETSITSEGKAEKTPEMTMWLSESGYSGMSAGEKAFIVIDGEQEQMVTFMDETKNYMSMALDFLGNIAVDETPDEAEGDFTFTKTGRTENILGYPCDVYKMTGNDTEAYVWVTDALGVDMAAYMQGFAGLMKNSAQSLPNLAGTPFNGMFLKMESKDLKTNESMVMEATAVDENGKSFNTSGYSSIGF